MDIKKEKEIKTIIRGLVLSASKGVTVSQISRDFREMIGENIPFRYYGYPSLISFLESLTDTIKVIHSGQITLIVPIVTEKTLHLEEMVQKQKKLPPKGRRPMMVIPRPRAIRQKNLRKQSFSSSHETNFKSRFESETQSEDDDYEYNTRCPKPDNEFQPSVEQDQEDFYSNRFKMNDHLMEREKVQNTVSEPSFVKSKVKIYNESYNLIETSSSDKQRCSNLKRRLIELISSHPDGIWCSDLPYIYHEKFNSELNIQAMGYTNVAHFCSTYIDIFKCVRLSDSDWKVFDARYPLPKLFLEQDDVINSEMKSCKKPVALPDNDEEKEVLEFENYDYPENVVKYGEKIVAQNLPECSGDYFAVRVTEVYDPSKFWFQIYSEECSAALDDLMEEIQLHYSQIDDRFQLPDKLMLVGMYCIAKYEFEWTRAMIVKVEELLITVYYFDYGSLQSCNRTDVILYFLHKDFAILPRQGIRGRLSGVRPNSQDNLWSRSASYFFLDFVTNKNLVALINQENNIDFHNHAVDLVLTDTSSDEDIHINDLMVSKNFASQEVIKFEIQELCCLTTENSLLRHLFPLHRDIEWGRVLSVNEIDTLASGGIKMEHIFKLNMEELEKNRMKKYESTISLYLKSEKVETTETCTDTVDFKTFLTDELSESRSDVSYNTIDVTLSCSKDLEKEIENSEQQTLIDSQLTNNVESYLNLNTEEETQNTFTTPKRQLRPPPGFSSIPMNKPIVSPTIDTHMSCQNVNVQPGQAPTLNPIYNPVNCNFNFNINLNSNFETQALSPQFVMDKFNQQLTPCYQSDRRQISELFQPFNNLIPPVNINRICDPVPLMYTPNLVSHENLLEPQFSSNKSIELYIANLLKNSFSSNEDNESAILAINAENKIDELKCQTKFVKDSPKLIPKINNPVKIPNNPHEWSITEKDFSGKTVRLFQHRDKFLMATRELLLKFTQYQDIARVKYLLSVNPQSFTSKSYKLDTILFNAKDPFLGFDETTGTIELILIEDITLFLENIFCFDINLSDELNNFIKNKNQ